MKEGKENKLIIKPEVNKLKIDTKYETAVKEQLYTSLSKMFFYIAVVQCVFSLGSQ